MFFQILLFLKFYFGLQNCDNNTFIINYISDNISITENVSNKLKLIFKYLEWNNIHLWYDLVNNKFKIYLWLYNHDFKNCLKEISSIKGILEFDSKYFLEKDFLKFDCIWIDISEGNINIKLYELINKRFNYDLYPSFLDEESIKEVWYLKDFFSRKKMFFRFLRI